jgi:hypothetical protein
LSFHQHGIILLSPKQIHECEMTIRLGVSTTNHTYVRAHQQNKRLNFTRAKRVAQASVLLSELSCVERNSGQKKANISRAKHVPRTLHIIRLTFSPSRVIKCARPPKRRFLGLATRFRSCRAAVRAVRLGRVGVQDD